MKTKLLFLFVLLAIFSTSHSLFGQDLNFVLSSSPVVGQQPYTVCATDINGDGKLDLISANYQDGTLTVLTNDGNGGFVLASTLFVGQSISVCAADVNGDGKVDLISANLGMFDDYVTNYLNNTLTIMTNDGVGGFKFASAPVVGLGPDSVCAADVNSDGKMDLICVNIGDQTLTVLMNDGHGNFALSSTLPVGTSPECVIAADVNGDGKVDLVCANYDSPLMIYTNDGSGGFVFASQYFGGGLDCVVATDVNGDGKVDLIFSDFGSIGISSAGVLTNDGSGNFQLASFWNLPANTYSVCTADVNGDGKIDLITANSGYIPIEPSFGPADYYYTNILMVFTNDGSGNFTFATSPNVGIRPYCVIAADVNGDGRMDLISANVGDDTLAVLTNATVFSPPTSIPPLTIKPSSLGIQVSWPSATPGWSLQQNPDLTTANWGPSGYSGFNILDDGTNKSVAMPASSGNLFFRLLHP